MFAPSNTSIIASPRCGAGTCRWCASTALAHLMETIEELKTFGHIGRNIQEDARTAIATLQSPAQRQNGVAHHLRLQPDQFIPRAACYWIDSAYRFASGLSPIVDKY